MTGYTDFINESQATELKKIILEYTIVHEKYKNYKGSIIQKKEDIMECMGYTLDCAFKDVCNVIDEILDI